MKKKMIFWDKIINFSVYKFLNRKLIYFQIRLIFFTSFLSLNLTDVNLKLCFLLIKHENWSILPIFSGPIWPNSFWLEFLFLYLSFIIFLLFRVEFGTYLDKIKSRSMICDKVKFNKIKKSEWYPNKISSKINYK